MRIFFSLLFVIIIYSLLFIHYVIVTSSTQKANILGKSTSVTMDISIGEYQFDLFGYSSANALVTIEGMGIYDQTYADKTGYFKFNNRFSPFNPREACLTARDQFGRTTSPTCIPPFPTRYNVSIGPVILPPTVSADAQNYYQGDEIKLSGQTIPNTEVKFSIFAGNRGITRMITQKNAESLCDGDLQQDAEYCEKREDTFFETIAWVPFRGEAVEKNGIERFIVSFFGLVKPVEAFSFPELTVKSDEKGNFSLSLPSSRPETFRLFAQTSYENGESPESIKLNIKILPVWMIIVQFFLFIWSLIKSRLLEILILGELIGLTIFFLRRYLHPHAIARNRALSIRELYPIVEQNLSIIPHEDFPLVER